MATRLVAYNLCYQNRLKRGPEVPIDLVLGFTIEIEGSTAYGRVIEGTGLDTPMNQCVLDVLANTRFPEPQGGHVKVKYPLQFRPE